MFNFSESTFFDLFLPFLYWLVLTDSSASSLYSVSELRTEDEKQLAFLVCSEKPSCCYLAFSVVILV